MKAVYAEWKELPHAPFRLLAYMAVVSLDAPDGDIPARRFFAGREAMAVALGSMPPPEDLDDPVVVRERRAAFGRVDRALKVLIEEGAVTRVKAAGHFSNAHYALNVRGASRTTVSVAQDSDHGERGSSGEVSEARTTVSVDLQDHGERGPKDHGERGSRTTVSVTTDHGERGAEEYEEEEGLTGGGTGSGSPHPAGSAHTREREPLRAVPTDGIRDPLPAVAGVPGQRAMLLPVSTSPRDVGEALEGQDDAAVPYGRCEGCDRAFLRSRPACPHCGLMRGTA
ncbi:hypothetical protein QNO09_23300 [Streptomyces sp. 378]|uniref:hypothetical protein n=1 Tax=Streptomyces sp. 378 TaxID=3049412 RepID=UPI0024C2AFE9|nr:hypothetical protein [Streptomyces sp. 378]MDK1346182.1 hypothetical protein [Streptomyces sp. 378]